MGFCFDEGQPLHSSSLKEITLPRKTIWMLLWSYTIPNDFNPFWKKSWTVELSQSEMASWARRRSLSTNFSNLKLINWLLTSQWFDTNAPVALLSHSFVVVHLLFSDGLVVFSAISTTIYLKIHGQKLMALKIHLYFMWLL